MTCPRALLLAFALLQALGVFEAVRRSACEEECKRDGCNGTCTPDNDCPQCPCHSVGSASLAASIAANVTVARVAYVTKVSFARADQYHASPDPREILHVPRTSVI